MKTLIVLYSFALAAVSCYMLCCRWTRKHDGAKINSFRDNLSLGAHQPHRVWPPRTKIPPDEFAGCVEAVEELYRSVD